MQLAVAQPVAMPPAAEMDLARVEGLYVHVPFCFHKCHYCDFYSITRQTPERMALFVDPRFESKDSPQKHTGGPMDLMAKLQKDKGSFLESYGYSWVLDSEAYNSEFEALLQWRLLNTLSDIRTDHPALERCANFLPKPTLPDPVAAFLYFR